MEPDFLRVLLVEDNPGDARLIREMLTEIHSDRYEVVHVERLAQALLHLSEGKFNAVLLDLNLPDAYGLSTLIKVRATAPHVPVIVVSGLGDEEMAIHALREGAYTYLVKGQMSGHLLDRSIRYSIERERMEQIVQLKRAREYAENIVDTIRESLIVLDNSLRIVSANRSFYLEFHVTPEQVEGQFIHDIADQEWNIPKFLALLEKILHRSFEYEGLELDHEFPALGRRVMLLNARWVYEERGDTDRILLAIEDITERKRAEEALADEKERLAVTLWNIGEGVIVTDVNGLVVMMNRVAESLTGWTADQATGLPIDQVYRVVNEKTGDPCANPVAAILKKEGMKGSSHLRLLIGKDGVEHPLGDSVAAVRDKDGKIIGVVIVFRDVTAARRMEEDLAKNERLESIGVLAGGIAHDFNNALTAIEGNIVVAKAHLKPEEKAYERLSEAEKASHRARDLTRQLLTFARGGKPIKRQLHLNDLLTDSVSFALSGSGVRKKVTIAEDLWPVEVDEEQIRQVINNLVINADQAMPEGGMIEVTADNVSLALDQVILLKAGDYVRVMLKDHGIGIPKEFISKIYEPYFTTKQKGSGLGLTVAYSVLRNHGGSMTVDSVVGVGSTFTLYLPASQMQPPVEQTPLVQPLRGNERILWMDDEAMIREVGSEMLSLLGYQYAFAEEGEKAVELYRAALQTDSPFDAVILDLTGAGGLGGKDTIRALLELDPQVRAIVCSGYSNDPVMATHRECGFRGVLTKPFTMKELDEQIHRVIGTEE